MLSSLVPIFKRRGNPLNPNPYWRIKLLEHVNCTRRFGMGLCMRWYIIIKCNMGLC